MLSKIYLQLNKSVLWLLQLLLLLLLLTVFIGWSMYQQSISFTQAVFEQHLDDLVQSLQMRMREHEQILLGTKGLYDASQSVERHEFHLYIDSLDVSKKYPGIQLIGFSQWVKPTQLVDAINVIRAEGFPQFNMRPQGERDNYSMIIYAEPFSGRNLAAFGFDMFSEPVRRQAMTASVETNQATLSSKVTLVQENQGPVQAGSLLYLPIFKKHMPIATVDERWQALEGFVYAAFRMGDLMNGLMSQQHALNIDFTMYSGDAADARAELYNSNTDITSTKKAKQNFVPAYTQDRAVTLFGQVWLIRAFSNKEFERQHKSYAAVMALVVGTCVSLLICITFYVLARQRQSALSLADRMTENVRVQHIQLKNSQERFQLAIESSAIGIWSLRFSDKNLQWDDSMYALFGLVPGKKLTTYESFFALVHTDDRQRVLSEITHAIDGKLGCDTEYRVLWPDHSIHYLASRARIIDDSDGELSMIGTCWDITERKRLDKAKTEFVSTVSHELRTPLTAITGALGVVMSGALCELPDKAKQILDIAYKNSQRLKLLINDLLDMDKLLAGKLEFHCEVQTLTPLIERAVTENKSYADQMQVRFVIVPAEINPCVNIEDIRFLQIMANFLSNAAKFSKPDSDVLITLTENAGYARVSVSDTGVGLDAESKSHIFEKFYQADSSDTRKKGGTGLGLAIAKEIAERMNGRVGFTSVLGEGSTFYAEFRIEEIK
jgi:PAS domain S-box-containing protein